MVLIVFFSSQNLALDVHGDFLRQVALGHRRGHVRDVAHLARQVARHGIDAVGQVFPGSRDALYIGLPAELAFGANFPRHGVTSAAKERSWSTMVLIVFFSS